jgi:hypothetical protein
LFAQQISGDTGVHSTAHAKKNPLFCFVHWNEEFRSRDA